jgi:hypothetical protein
LRYLTILALLIAGGSLQKVLANDPLTGFPDADPNSGKFITVTKGEQTLGEVSVGQHTFNVSIRVRAAATPQGNTWMLKIFDGDVGGFFDTPSSGGDTILYELFPDPNIVGNTAGTPIFTVASTALSDNGWDSFPITQTNAALNATTGDYFYHLVATWTTNNVAQEQNLFKIAAEGQPFLLKGSTIGFQGVAGPLQPSNINYDGKFVFLIGVPASTTRIDLYDGDADRADDTDDPNSPPGIAHPDFATCLANTNTPGCPNSSINPFPPFQTPMINNLGTGTNPQGANPGSPADDAPSTAYGFTRSPSIFYTVTAPGGAWTATNDNPSGNREWELFRINTAPDGTEDVVEPSLPPGGYTWTWQGVDAFNNFFVHSDYILVPCPGGVCPPPPCPLDQVCDPPPPGCVSSIQSDFNGTSIPKNNSVWFNSVMKVSGQGSTPFTIHVTAQSAVSSAFNVPLPNANITFANVATATTTFDAGTNTWNTTVPLSYTGNVFISGAMLPLPNGLPGGLNPVTWTGSFSKPSSVKVDWQWAAAAYNTLLSTTGIGVKSVDSNSLDATYKNSDHAGTPESVKSLMGNGGARGGGGSNFTGSYSGTGHACVN